MATTLMDYLLPTASDVQGLETMHLDLGILVKKKAQANIRDAATGRLFLVVFLLCEYGAAALASPTLRSDPLSLQTPALPTRFW